MTLVLNSYIIYINLIYSHSVCINRLITIVLAVLSSGAVTGWAIWNKYSFVWAFIVAFSQVATIINEFLPYKNRINELQEMSCKSTNIYDDIEQNWLQVSSGEMSESEINICLYKRRKLWNKALGDCLNDDSLPERKKLINKADRNKNVYFENLFGGIYGDESEQQTESVQAH